MPAEERHYEIKVRGHLDPMWSDWFAGLQVTHIESGDSLLSGFLPDQAALYGVLERLRDLNVTLISVECKTGLRHRGHRRSP